MAGETTTATTSTAADTTAPAAVVEAPKSFTQEDVERIVGERVGRERAKFSEVEDKAKKFDELQDASRSDLEKLTGERDTFKTTAESATVENLRLRIALVKQLPSELVDRLRGSTEDEIKADADELLKLVKPAAVTSFDGGRGRDSASTAPTGMNDFLRRAVGK